MRTRSLGVMLAVMAMGCSRERGPTSCDFFSPPLAAKVDIEGTWSYTVAVVEARGTYVRTSDPVLVRTRIEEQELVFETIVDPHPVQAFRVLGHGTIEPEVLQTCEGPRHRETYDARPWTAHNGFAMDWSQGLVPPPLLMQGALDVTPTFLGSHLEEPWWLQERIARDAAGQAVRWTMPSVYVVTMCEGMPSCASDVRVLHTFTRVTAP